MKEKKFESLEKVFIKSNFGKTIYGIDQLHFSFLLGQFAQNEANLIKEPAVFVFSNEDDAELFYSTIQENLPHLLSVYFPGFEASPYGSILSPEINAFDRYSILSNISVNIRPHFVVTTYDGLLIKNPSLNYFSKKTKLLTQDDIISPQNLKDELLSLGYSHAHSIEEPGTFSHRGEVFDIYPINEKPIRLNYFDDLIEKISYLDPETKKSVKDSVVQSVYIAPTPASFLFEDTNILREKIPQLATHQKLKFESRKNLFSKLAEKHQFDNYIFYSQLIHTDFQNLLEALPEHTVFAFESDAIQQNLHQFLEDLSTEYKQKNDDVNIDNIFPSLENIYETDIEKTIKKFNFKFNKQDFSYHTETDSNSFSINFVDSKNFLAQKMQASTDDRYEHLKQIFSFLKERFKSSGQIIFCSTHETTIKEVEYLLGLYEVTGDLRARFQIKNYHIQNGFYYETENVLILSEQDLFARKTRKTTKSISYSPDLFAEQLGSLRPGDFVIHKSYGVGKYLGLESMNIGGSDNDFLIIEYADNDKVFVPVYKFNLIQKHADHHAEIKTASLRNTKFLQAKEKARQSAQTLAFDLLRLQAERQLAKAFSFSPPDHMFKEFELDFAFEETRDQLRAINNVLADMQKPVPMDHLVCGDVGFGKTEVAMRAAMKAVLDKKQVAILVPTTVLAFQHYNSFINRFKKFPVNIEFLSRFKSTNEVKQIKDDLNTGKIDIVVGTHKLLSKDIKFFDLGLVIIDEEQRFGVEHKEKFKLMKKSVDFLTLTATPIPRTLQLAFLGIRDLSLIQTAPPRRQTIKTYLVKKNDQTIKEAIEKEVARGGQVFYVHNRVQDLPELHGYLKELVPNLKICVAHGQLSEKELEVKIRDFYLGKYDVLLSTTIIESGIDIPTANTMIIDHADNFGLSQLHQLRGRIGRSDRKAYAYLVIPPNKQLSTIAEKRLKALQQYSEMGSGFSIASCDLELRGAGDILGASQSGHIDSVGLELYMDLLKEAIQEIRGERKSLNRDIEIVTPFSTYIPSSYIKDSGERLKLYKKLSRCESIDEIDSIRDDVTDMNGQGPIEFKNLIDLLSAKIHLIPTGIKSIKVSGANITFEFDQNILEKDNVLKNKIIDTFIKRPKVYQFTPDYRVIYSHKSNIDLSTLMSFAKDIAQQIVLS